MLSSMDSWDVNKSVSHQIEALRSELLSCAGQINRLRALQVELIRKLDRHKVETAGGARTTENWVSDQLDLSRETASQLAQVAHAADPEIDRAMAEGRLGLYRAAELVKLPRPRI